MTLEEIIQPGHAVRVFYNPGNINNRLIHIRAIVDEDQVVFRWWSKHKQCWIYQVEDMYYFTLRHNDGRLTLVK